MAEFLPAAVGGFSNPATLLIEKVSNAIGRHFDPRQVIRMAEAEAKADRIRAVSHAETEIEMAELRQRAAERFIEEQMRMQSNMENIAAKAIPHLTDDAEPDKIEDDWIANFFDKSRIVSDDQMQDLWAKVLADEGNRPGSFSRKTVNLLADLSKHDAETFTNLCGFCWVIHENVELLIFDEQLPIYNQSGIHFNSLIHLDALGLIRFSELANVARTNLPQSITTLYGKEIIGLRLSGSQGNQLDVGKVTLTRPGLELLLVADVEPVRGFLDYVCDRWESQSIVVSRSINHRVEQTEM